MSNKLVILMAGESKRFTEAGYNKKYFLPVSYKNRTYPMFIQTIRNIKNEFSKVKQKYFKEIVIAHNDNPFLIKYWLNKANIKATLINVGKTNGSLETLLKVFGNEDKLNDGYVVANVDQLFTFNNELNNVDKFNLDSKYFSLSFINNKENDNKWSYVNFNNDNLITECKEKEKISNNANVGIYGFGYFFLGKIYTYFYLSEEKLDYCKFNNEYYIAPLLNESYSYNVTVDKFYSLGTPEDYEKNKDILL